jgi:hypothetical protein
MIALFTVVLALQDWSPPPASDLSFNEAYACATLGKAARDFEFPGTLSPQTTNERRLWDGLTRLQVEAGAVADAAARREGLTDRPAAEAFAREQLARGGDDTAAQLLARCKIVFGVT